MYDDKKNPRCGVAFVVGKICTRKKIKAAWLFEGKIGLIMETEKHDSLRVLPECEHEPYHESFMSKKHSDTEEPGCGEGAGAGGLHQ